MPRSREHSTRSSSAAADVVSARARRTSASAPRHHEVVNLPDGRARAEWREEKNQRERGYDGYNGEKLFHGVSVAPSVHGVVVGEPVGLPATKRSISPRVKERTKLFTPIVVLAFGI
jgi:hypothetical protein